MKKLYIIFSLLIFLPSSWIFCQEETSKIRVTVVPMINVEQNERLDVITQTVTDTVSLYLKLIRKYRVFVEEDIDPYRDPDCIRLYFGNPSRQFIVADASKGNTLKRYALDSQITTMPGMIDSTIIVSNRHRNPVRFEP